MLPETTDMSAVPNNTGRTETLRHELGVGYARLAIQLIADGMGLHRVWLMDDNVQDCYKLAYQTMLRTGKHEKLQK